MPLPRDHCPQHMPTPPVHGFYVFIVQGGIDPVCHRRFSSGKARDAYMKRIYSRQINEEHNDLPCYLNVSKAGKVRMGAYPRDCFEDLPPSRSSGKKPEPA